VVGWGVAGALTVLVLLPLFAVVAQVLWPGLFRGDLGFGDLSILGDIVRRPLWRVSLTNSLRLAFGAMIVGTLLGGLLAYARHTYRFRGAALLDTAAWVLLITPSFIISQGWILFANRNGIVASTTGTTWVTDAIFTPDGLTFIMALKNYPLAYLTVSAAMLWNVDDLQAAARLSGASPWRAFRTIRLPLLFPAIASGAVLVFVDTIGDFGLPASLATVYRFPTLPYTIFVAINQSPIRFDLAGVLSAYLTLILVAAVWIQFRLMRRSFFDFLTGRAAPPVRFRPRSAPLLSAATGLFLLLAFVIPIGTSVLVSLLASFSEGPVAGNFTLAHYREALSSGGPLLEALRNSLVIAGIAAIAALFLGLLASFVLTFARSSLSRVIDATSTISLAVPGVILGVGTIFVWNQPWLDRIGLNPYGRPIILVMAAVAGAVPYVVRVTLGAMAQIPTSFLDAAALQGATLGRRLRTILAPLTVAAVTSAGLAAFGSAVFDLAITTILRPPGFAILPHAITRQFEQGFYGVSTAMTVLATIATVGIIVTVNAAVRRRVRRTSGGSAPDPTPDDVPVRLVGTTTGASS
jgi:iron(III) transport system permease protein